MFELTQTSDGRNVLALPSALDHGILVPLKAALMSAIENGQPLDIDASAVRKITTQAAQLLVAARMGSNVGTASQLRVISPSPAVTEFAATLALEEHLGLTENSR